VGVHRAVGPVEITAEGDAHQVFPAEDPPGMRQEGFHQAKFGSGELEWLAAAGEAATVRLQPERSVRRFQRAALRRAGGGQARRHAPLSGGTTEQGAHPGDQLAGAEGFGEVVVGAQVEALEQGVFVGPGGQHEYGQAPALRRLADGTADLLASDVRQHQVEHQQLGPAFAPGGQAASAVAGLGHGVAGVLQVRSCHLAYPRLVVDHQHPGHACLRGFRVRKA
jgi:hypothetical protein